MTFIPTTENISHPRFKLLRGPRFVVPAGAHILPIDTVLQDVTQAGIRQAGDKGYALGEADCAVIDDSLVLATSSRSGKINLAIVDNDGRERSYTITKNTVREDHAQEASPATQRARSIAVGLCASSDSPGKIAESDPATQFTYKTNFDNPIRLCAGAYIIPKSLVKHHHEDSDAYISFAQDNLAEVTQSETSIGLNDQVMAYKDGFVFQLMGADLVSISPNNIIRFYSPGDRAELELQEERVLDIELDSEATMIDRARKVRTLVALKENRQPISHPQIVFPQPTRPSTHHAGTFVAMGKINTPLDDQPDPYLQAKSGIVLSPDQISTLRHKRTQHPLPVDKHITQQPLSVNLGASAK